MFKTTLGAIAFGSTLAVASLSSAYAAAPAQPHWVKAADGRRCDFDFAGKAYGVPFFDANLAICLGLDPNEPITVGTPTQPNEIHLTRDRESHVITARVNGIFVYFTLDTGSEDISLSQSDAARLHLTSADVVGQVIVHDANGGVAQRPVVRLRELTLGQYVFHDIEASVGNSSLLGQPVLRRFASYTIDYQRDMLVIGSAPAPTPSASVLAPDIPPMPSAFNDGHNDRLAFEAWVQGLTGYTKEGALYWASVRSTKEARLGCGEAAGATSESWTRGCEAALEHLDPTDRRRGNEPDYKAGWNSASREIEGPKPWNRDPGPTGEAEASTAYQAGLTDRTRLETWLRSIGDGPYHSGAAYWLSVRSTPQRVGACYPGGVASTDGHTEGCLAAKKMTDPIDYRRTHEPDYKAGWNSYSGPGA